MKVMNFSSNHLAALQSRQKKRAVLEGISYADRYDVDDRVSIRVEGKPIAEGIIKSVMIESIGQIIKEGVAEGEKTTEKMTALNDYCLEHFGKKLRMGSIVVVINWEYI
jgi:hypothetical protein